MKVIFIKDLKKQGRINDIKEVSDGYAINYLIKNGYAVKYTKTSKDILNKDILNKKIKEEELISEAKKIKKKLEKIKLVFKVSSNNGRMFGSISSKQICEELLKYDIHIDKKMINIDGALSSLGVHNVNIMLHKEVPCNLSIHIVEK